MKAGFSPKLALLGIKKNARLYVPYLLSCAFMAAVLYVIAFLAATPALYVINGKINGAGTTTIQLVMSLGSGVISIFAALFLFYTNSFLLRRRKKEFGLYSVLGMDRGALGTILFWETLMAAAFTLVAGLSEYFRAQAVRCHVCRHLRAALRARCAVAQARAGRGTAKK